MVKYLTRGTVLKGKKLTTQQKIAVVEAYKSSGLPKRRFCEVRDVAYSTFNKWETHYNKMMETSIDDFHENRGRPRIFTETATENIVDTVKEKEAKQEAPSQRKFREICHDALVTEKRRRNKAPVAEEPSQSTYQRLKRSIKATVRTVQLKTPARIVAEADPRNVYSMITMIKALCEFLDPNMIFNFDNTQYVIDKDSDDQYICIKVEGNDPIVAPGTGKLGLAVKYYHFHNANGYSGELVIVISDDSMGEESMEMFPIQGYSNNTAIDSVGYLVFTKSRCGNKAFFRWYITFIVIPFINKCRDVKQCKVSMLKIDICYYLYCFAFKGR
jgi:hypothetical protein